MAEPSLLALSRRAPRSGDLFLTGVLDHAGVAQLTTQLVGAGRPPLDVYIRCDGLSAVEPDGAARLWLLFHELERERGHRIRLLGLPDRLAWMLRSHPLAPYIVSDEELFRDPFTAGDSSAR
jgi:hypothetical protein